MAESTNSKIDEREDRAEEEFYKNSELKKNDLQELRSWLETEDHLPIISEKELITFLHSCYYNIANTKKCIEAYYTCRTRAPELFKNRHLKLPANQEMLSTLYYIQFPVADPNGCNIIFHSLKPSRSEPSMYMFADALKVYLMLIDACIEYDRTAPGIILLLDAKNVKFGHITRLSVNLLRKGLTYVQEGLPVRLKAVHVLNVMFIVDQIMYLVKPLINKELFKLIHFHRGDNESIFEYLPKKCLPQDFGGELPTVAELEVNYIPKFMELQDCLKEQEKYCVDESKRRKKK